MQSPATAPTGNKGAPTVDRRTQPVAESNGHGEALLTVKNLVMHFPLTRGIIFQ